MFLKIRCIVGASTCAVIKFPGTIAYYPKVSFQVDSRIAVIIKE